MHKSIKLVLTELLWLLAALAATFGIGRYFFLENTEGDTIDLHLHDTYFVLSPFILYVPLFLLLTFILFFVKEVRKKFSRILPNTVLLVSGLLLLLTLFVVNKEIVRMFASMTTNSYPPAADMDPAYPASPALDPVMKLLMNAAMLLQLVITVALLYAVFRWGSHRRKIGN